MYSALRTSLALTLLSSLGVLVSASTASASAPVSISDCGTLKVAPSSLVISCADANRSITDIKWTNWGQAVAQGKGMLNWNTCTPTCVSGTYRHQSLTFRAQRRGTRGAHVLYLELSGPKGAFGTAGTTWTLTTPHAG